MTEINGNNLHFQHLSVLQCTLTRTRHCLKQLCDAQSQSQEHAGTPAASCTGVFLRARILTDMALAAFVYCGSVSTAISAFWNAGVPAWVGSICSPKPCTQGGATSAVCQRQTH